MTYKFKLSRRLACLWAATPAALLMLVMACSDESTSPSAPVDMGGPDLLSSDPVVRVNLTPDNINCVAGAQVSLTATPYRQSGIVAEGRRMIFRVRDTTIAGVTVTAAQTATLRCKANGSTKAFADIDRKHDSSTVVVGATLAGSTPTPTTPPPTTTTTTTTPLPFGFFHTPTSEYRPEWSGALYTAGPAYLVGRLDLAKANRMKLIVAMAPTGRVRNSNGTFSLTKWKAQVDQYRSLSLGSYITGGTLYLHYLIDEPYCASCWGGSAIPWSTVEEMARYSKSIWPNLPTAVRSDPSRMTGAGFTWKYLDAAWAQYNTRRGELRTFLYSQVTAAKTMGLGLMLGLNLLDGSGTNTAPMTVSEVKAFGTILAQEPMACGLLGWRYDDGFMSQTGMRAAMDSVAKVARLHAPTTCVRH